MTLTAIERIDAIRRELREALAEPATSPNREMPLSNASSIERGAEVVSPICSDSSTWAQAVRIARLRDERRSSALDSSVRALAREFRCSHGRAGELLKIHRNLAEDLILLGRGSAIRGEAMLKRLRYRQFRELLKIEGWMRMTRVAAIRRMLDNK